MLRRPPRSPLFPTRRSSDLRRRKVAGDRSRQRITRVIADDEISGPANEQRERLSSSDRKSTRLNSSHANISYAVFCLKKKKNHNQLNHSSQQTYTSTKPLAY